MTTETAQVETETPPPVRPDGEFAIVEVLGHRTIVGRTTEVERFGTKFLAVEAIWEGGLLEAVLIGGASIYQMTPCSAAVAFARAPKQRHQLPPSIAITLPPAPPALLSFDPDHDDAVDENGLDFDPAFLSERC